MREPRPRPWAPCGLGGGTHQYPGELCNSCDPDTDSTWTDSQVGVRYFKSLNFNLKIEVLDVRIQISVDLMEMDHTVFLLYWLSCCRNSGSLNTCPSFPPSFNILLLTSTLHPTFATILILASAECSLCSSRFPKSSPHPKPPPTAPQGTVDSISNCLPGLQ